MTGSTKGRSMKTTPLLHVLLLAAQVCAYSRAADLVPIAAADSMPGITVHRSFPWDVPVYPAENDLVDRSGAATFALQAADLAHPNGAELLLIDEGGNIVLPSIDMRDVPPEKKTLGAPPVLWALEVNSTYPLYTGDARCDESLARAMKEAPPHSYVICLRDDRLRRMAMGTQGASSP